jgi:hypothetical protein
MVHELEEDHDDDDGLVLVQPLLHFLGGRLPAEGAHAAPLEALLPMAFRAIGHAFWGAGHLDEGDSMQ